MRCFSINEVSRRAPLSTVVFPQTFRDGRWRAGGGAPLSLGPRASLGHAGPCHATPAARDAAGAELVDTTATDDADAPRRSDVCVRGTCAAAARFGRGAVFYTCFR